MFLGARLLKNKDQFSKFKPIGAESVHVEVKTPREQDEEEESEENKMKVEKMEGVSVEALSEYQGQSTQRTPTGIAAAGFKKFEKKSISIKIKTNEGVAGEPTDKADSEKANLALIQKKHISKRPKQVELAKKPEEENEPTPAEKALTDSEKLRAQFDQYNAKMMLTTPGAKMPPGPIGQPTQGQ